MTYKLEDVVKAGISLRPHLSELLSPDQAQTFDDELVKLMAEAQNNPQDISKQRMLKLFSTQSKVRDWTEDFLKNKLPLEKEISFEQIPGQPSTVSGFIKYACPQENCDYVWYQYQQGETIPSCEIHNVPLEKM